MFCMMIVGLINEPWPTLTLMGICYLFTLPMGSVALPQKERLLARGEKDPDDTMKINSLRRHQRVELLCFICEACAS